MQAKLILGMTDDNLIDLVVDLTEGDENRMFDILALCSDETLSDVLESEKMTSERREAFDSWKIMT